MVYPIPGARIGDRFGMRWLDGVRQLHAGVDFNGVAAGTGIQAAAPGVVTASEWSGTYGWYVTIDHGGVTTLYAHMRSRSPLRQGHHVSAGTYVGAVGNTGMSYGAHLHFGTFRGAFVIGSLGNAFDPLPWLDSLSASNYQEEDNMFKVCKLDNGDIFVVGPKKIKHLGNMDDVAASEQMYGPMVNEHKSRLHMIFCDVPFGDARKHVNITYP